MEKELLSIYEKYQVVTIVGSETIIYNELKRNGRICVDSQRVQAPGRILRFESDD